MAITIDDFSKIWASTSPLTPYEFSENNYKSGWNFIGSTPPSRQMWDFLQKNNDKKMQYLANNYLPLSGGTMTGAIKGNPVTLTADDGNGNTKSFVANADGTLTWDGSNVLTDKVTSVDNLSSIMSFESGFALRGGYLRIVGGVFALLRLGVNISKSISANSFEQVGTITNATYRPAADSYFGGAEDNIATIAANGNIQVRFLSAKGSGNGIWLQVLYLLV